jgi:hypothetical protein
LHKFLSSCTLLTEKRQRGQTKHEYAYEVQVAAYMEIKTGTSIPKLKPKSRLKVPKSCGTRRESDIDINVSINPLKKYN